MLGAHLIANLTRTGRQNDATLQPGRDDGALAPAEEGTWVAGQPVAQPRPHYDAHPDGESAIGGLESGNGPLRHAPRRYGSYAESTTRGWATTLIWGSKYS